MIHEAFRFMMVKTTCLQQCLDSWHFHVFSTPDSKHRQTFRTCLLCALDLCFPDSSPSRRQLGSAARLVAGENIDIQHAVNASQGDDADGSPELFENFGLFLTNSKKVQPHKLLYLFD